MAPNIKINRWNICFVFLLIIMSLSFFLSKLLYADTRHCTQSGSHMFGIDNHLSLNSLNIYEVTLCTFILYKYTKKSPPWKNFFHIKIRPCSMTPVFQIQILFLNSVHNGNFPTCSLNVKHLTLLNKSQWLIDINEIFGGKYYM